MSEEKRKCDWGAEIEEQIQELVWNIRELVWNGVMTDEDVSQMCAAVEKNNPAGQGQPAWWVRKILKRPTTRLTSEHVREAVARARVLGHRKDLQKKIREALRMKRDAEIEEQIQELVWNKGMTDEDDILKRLEEELSE